jgi:hypothetical protein
MTFEAFETTDGSPVELVTFRNGANEANISNLVAPVTIGAKVFSPLAYTRTSFSQSKDSDDNNITMEVPQTFSVVDFYGGVLTSFITTVTIERYHLDDPAEELQVAWKGQVVSIDRAGDKARLLLQPLTQGAEVTPPDTFSALCNSFLFQSPGCNLIRDQWRFVATLTSVSVDGLELVFNGLRAQAASLDAAQGGPTGPLTSAELDIYWQGGYIATGGGETRSIVEGNVTSDPDRVRVDLPFRDFNVGEGASVYAGCDLTIATCHKKFDNAIQFQGYPYIPEIDPANTELPPGDRKSGSKFAGPQT